MHKKRVEEKVLAVFIVVFIFSILSFSFVSAGILSDINDFLKNIFGNSNNINSNNINNSNNKKYENHSYYSSNNCFYIFDFSNSASTAR